jgi:hypothetical protein
MVSDKSLQKFEELYRSRYKVKLSREEAITKANNLVNFYRAVYKPVPKINIRNGKKLQDKQN